MRRSCTMAAGVLAMATPPNVVGVVPIQFTKTAAPTQFTSNWALVEERPSGAVLRIGQGALSDVIARAASLPAVGVIAERKASGDVLEPTGADILLVRDVTTGLWYPLDPFDLQRLPTMAPWSTALRRKRHTATTSKTAVPNIATRWRATSASGWPSRRRGWSSPRLSTSRCSPGISAAGTSPAAARIAATTVNHILANCAIMDDSFVNYARSLGADPALIAKADYAVRKARGEFEWKPPPAPPDIYARPTGRLGAMPW